MDINYERNYEVEKLLNFIRVANNENSIRYASQIVSFVLSKYQIESEYIVKKIINIFKESSGIKKDYLSILFSEIYNLDMNNIESNELISYSNELLKEFRISPNNGKFRHIDLYYKSSYITDIYTDIDLIRKNDSINSIPIENVLIGDNYTEFVELCFSENIRFLGEINSKCIVESYEKRIFVRNIGKIIRGLSQGLELKIVQEKYIDRKKHAKKDENNGNFITKKNNGVRYSELERKEFLDKYKNITNLNDEIINEIFNYKYIIKDDELDVIKKFTKELNSIFENYLEFTNLKEMAKNIIKLMCNLKFEKEYTFQEVAEIYGVTKQRISQIFNKSCIKILSQIKKSSDGELGKEFYYILFNIFREFNSDYEKKLIITLQNKYLLNLYCSILELDLNANINDKMKHLSNLYNKNKSEYKKNIFLEQKEANRQKKLTERILKDVIWFDKVNILTQDIYSKIVQLRIIDEDNNNPNKSSYYSNKLGKSIQFESSSEKRYLSWVEECDDVEYYSVQPFEVKYFYEGREHIYYPDIFFVLNDGRAIVVEIKPIIEMPLERNILKYKALREFCNRKGFGVLYTDCKESFEKYASKNINKNFEMDIINELRKGPINWEKCQDIIYRHRVDNKEINFVIIKNNLKYTQNPFSLRL